VVYVTDPVDAVDEASLFELADAIPAALVR
jgi:hypothetical protein